METAEGKRPVEAVAVIHAYPPDTPEWKTRMGCAVNAYREGLVQRIIVTGGRNGLKGYNNPDRMREYLKTNGVPEDHIVWQDIPNDKVFTEVNTTDTADEVRWAMGVILVKGWQDWIVRPISNRVHMVRILRIYRFWARGVGVKLNLRPLTTTSMLGWKWALAEVLLLRLYTRFDPGWRGPLAERMRGSRRWGIPADKT